MPPATKQAKHDGRINLGFRRLIVSHVENAGTFYAYTEKDASDMAAIEKIDEQCATMQRIDKSPKLGNMYGVFHSGRWFRGEVEQIRGKDGRMVRVRMVDYGWKDFVQVSNLCQLPRNLFEAKVKCEKYKMAEMKPRGRYEGYSAADRDEGKVWLEKIMDGKVVDAECHILEKYGGGIQMECKVGNINLNQEALKVGHVIMLKDRTTFFNGNSGNNVDTLKMSNPQSLHKSQKPDRNNQQDKGKYKRDERMKKPSSASEIVASGDAFSDKKGGKFANQIKTRPSVDDELAEILLLLDQAAQARKKVIGSSEIKDGLMNLCNIPETVEAAVEIVDPLLEGVEAVTAASKLMEEAKKQTKDDAHKVALLESTTILYKCISKFLSQYTLKEDNINNSVEKVVEELNGMPQTIPASWRLLSVKADRVTKNNLLDIIKNVKKFLDESGAKKIVLASNSQKEVDNLTKSLLQTAEGIQAKYQGEAACKIHVDTGALMEKVKSALNQEISESFQDTKDEKNVEQNEASAVRSAWRALTALKSQLEFLKNKKEEYENIHKALEEDLTSS